MKTQITSNSTAVVQDLFTFHPDIVLADEQLPLSSMAEADSPGLSFDFKFPKGPEIETYVGDITQAKADMLVVPEGVSFKGLGYIGRQMMDLSPNFRKSREKLINEKKNKFAAWETYTSTINSKLFKHVIHSIVVPCPDQNVEEWSNRMHLLYQRIFQEADRKIATVLAVPLLGTGRGGGRLEDVIEAAVNSVVSFKPTHLKRILFVSNDPEIVVQIASRCEWERAHGGQGQKWRALNNKGDVSYSHSKARRPSSGKPKTGPISSDFKYLQSASTKTPRPPSAAGKKGHIGGNANEQTTRYPKGSKRETHRTGKDQKTVVSLYIHNARLQSDDNFRGIQKSGYAPEKYCSRATKTKNISQQSRAHSHGHGNKPWDQQEEFDEQNGRTFTDAEYRHKHNIIDLQIKHTRQKEDELNRVKVNHLLLIGNEISGAGGGPKWREHKSEDQEKKRNALKKVNTNFNPSTMDEERRLPQGLSDSDAFDGDDVGGDNEKDDSTSTASDEDTWVDTRTLDNVQSSLEHDKIRESRHYVVVEGRRKGTTGTQKDSHQTSCGEQLQGRHNLHGNQPKSTTTFHMDNNTQSSFGHLEIPESKEPHDDELPGPQSQGARPKDRKHEPSRNSPEDTSNSVDSPEKDICPICISEITDKKILHKCGHAFCRDCIDNSFKQFKPVCPSCNMVYGEIKGNQPDGQMDVGFSGEHLPGYEGHGTITITYYFPSGTQGVDHPHPGQPFKGTTRRAYLPDNKEGKEVLKLLRKAFDRKITFTIGRSTTTGQENVVTWNDIHHKTNKDGGPTRFGYPDKTYLQRVREELASKGVTPP